MRTRTFLLITTALFALTIAMSVYVWQLRRREIRAPRVRSNEAVSRVSPPAASGTREQITLYVAYDDPGELRAEQFSIPAMSNPQQRAEAILNALLGAYTAKGSPHPLASSSEVRNVFLVNTETAVIDLNSALVDSQISGVLAEELTVCSIVQSLATNMPSLTRVKFLVDGKQRDTLAGHVELARIYDVSQVNQTVNRLLPR